MLEFRKYMLETMLSRKQAGDTQLARIQRFEEQMEGHLAIIRKEFLGDQTRVGDIVREMADWKKIREPIKARLIAGNPDGALSLALNEASPHIEQILVDTDYVISFARLRALRFVEEGRARKVQAQLFLALLVVLSLAIYLALTSKLRQGILQIYDLVEHDATFDALTGAHNRRSLIKLGAAEIHRARRHRHPLSLMMMDLDHFKHVNDAHGHDAGDSVLCQFAAICSKHLREEDLLGRIGGEEFVILLPDTGLEGAMEAAERIRAEVAASRFKVAVGEYLSVTVSIGVTALSGEATIDTLLKVADDFLYQSKDAGRNRVSAGPAVPPPATV